MTAPVVKHPKRSASSRTGWLITAILAAITAGLLYSLHLSAENHARQAAVLAQSGDAAGAEAAYVRALRRFPFNGSYYASLAAVQEASGDAAAAASSRKKARFFGAK